MFFIPDKSWYPWHSGGPKGARLASPSCGYTNAKYTAGIKKMEAEAALPVIFNGLNAPENITYVQRQPNVVGGMCEDCLHVNYAAATRNREPAPIWNTEIDAALAAARTQQALDCVSPRPIRQRYARLRLRVADAGLQVAHRRRSMRIFTHRRAYRFRRRSCWYRPTLSAGPRQMSNSYAAAAEQYAREFRSCTIAGMSVGPCAAVVNPDSGKSVPLPFPRDRYRHTLVISGEGVVHELGDTGTISAEGPAPDRYLGPRGWDILFR